MKIRKNTILTLLILAAPRAISAQPDLGLEYLDPLGLPAAEAADPRVMAVDLVRYALTFTAILAVAVVLFGGFRLMVSMGNDDNIAKARGTIVSGLIGLALVMASYAIVNAIIDTANSAIAGG